MSILFNEVSEIGLVEVDKEEFTSKCKLLIEEIKEAQEIEIEQKISQFIKSNKKFFGGTYSRDEAITKLNKSVSSMLGLSTIGWSTIGWIKYSNRKNTEFLRDCINSLNHFSKTGKVYIYSTAILDIKRIEDKCLSTLKNCAYEY